MVKTLPPNAESVASIRAGEDKNSHALRNPPPPKKKPTKQKMDSAKTFKMVQKRNFKNMICK